MLQYSVQRLALFVPTLLLVSVLVFILMRIVPGDPALLILIGTEDGSGTYTQEELDKVRHEIGTDRPLVVQYGSWIWGLARGDLGQSVWDGTPVVDELKKRLPVTLELAVLSMIIATVIAIPLGVISAVKQDTWIDYAVKVYTVLGVAAPTFWIGILTIMVLAFWFNWLPPLDFVRLWEDPLTNGKQLIFPALVLGYHDTAFIARLTRSAMLEVLREDYVRTARSKGLGERVVISRHALKNALLPVVTVAGLQFGALMGGVILIESIFLIPGVGSLLIDSLQRRDFPIIQALIMLTAVIVLSINMVVDLLYGWLDPRVRYG
jgi:peptide/nickel transport system permease protein